MYSYLIIDDETLIRKGTIKKLEPLSHLITCCGEAANGKDGIELASSLHPDIIILDMQMPVMDGMELLPCLSSRFPDIALIVISGFQNFDYMKQAISSKAIDYILKPFSREEIQQTILSTIRALDNRKEQDHQLTAFQEEKEDACYALDLKLLYNLLMGYDTGSSQISSNKLHFINQMHHFVLLTLYFQKVPENLSVQEWLDENGFFDLALYLPHASIPQFKFLILFLPEEQTDTEHSYHMIQQFLEEFLPWIHHHSSGLRLGISNIHTDITALHTAFNESCEALNTQKVREEPPLCLFYRDTLIPINITWDNEDEFLFRIESGKTDAVRQLSELLFDHYLQIPGCTLADVKRHCEQITSQCRVILNYYLDSREDSCKPSTNMQSIVNTLFSLTEVKKYYMQFFLNITNLLQTQSVYNTAELVDRIQLYMQRNYQKNLTQDFLASLFFINRSYLSQLFKKKTGEKFVDYLNDIRIEKAKELLLHSNRKMYQIAKAVGYDNTKYFFRIFKKKTGISPEQFRNLEL